MTGTGRGQLYESSWTFFKELRFLSPFTRPVATESSLSQNLREGEAGEAQADEFVEDDDEEPRAATFQAKGRTSTPYKKNSKGKRYAADDVLLQASDILASVAKRPNLPDSPQPDADDLFGQTMAKLIKEIPDDMTKEMAKIECQQVIFRYRFSPQQNNNFGSSQSVRPLFTPPPMPRSYSYQSHVIPAASPTPSEDNYRNDRFGNVCSPTYPNEFINIGDMNLPK